MYPHTVEKIVSINQESIWPHAISEAAAIAICEIALNIPAKATAGGAGGGGGEGTVSFAYITPPCCLYYLIKRSGRAGPAEQSAETGTAILPSSPAKREREFKSDD